MHRRAVVVPAVFASTLLACGAMPTPDGGVDAGEQPCLAFPRRIDANYTVEKGCWLVLETPTIAAAVTVTVRPGARLIFSAGTRLSFSAEQVLNAVGTESEPILFTGASPVRGFWKGLRFDGTTAASTLEWVTVEYGGETTGDAEAANVKLTADSRGARVGFSHVTLRESQGYGLWLAGSAVLPTFTANTLTANTLEPLNIDAETVGRLDAASVFTGNGKDEIKVRSYRLTNSGTWLNFGVPYHLTSDLASLGSGQLTLSAGVKVIFPPEGALTISGDAAALITEGTAANPVVLTGETQARGAWEGVVFDGSNNTVNQLKYTRVEYAGNTSSDTKAAGVVLRADSHGVAVKIDHLVVRDSQGYGLRLAASARTDVTSSTFTANALGAVLTDSNAAHQLAPDSVFTGNDVDRVFVEGMWVSGAVVWQDLGVPYVFTGVSVSPQAVWTLAAGVVLEMRPQTRIDVGGDAAGFHCAGTATRPVVITGTQKTNGSWDGIDFDTTLNAENVFDNCIVEYGGGGTRFGWHGMINSRSDSHGVRVSVTNSTIRHSATWGIYFNRAQLGAVTGNTYLDNAQGDYFHEP